MAESDQDIRDFLATARESLGLELKQWIDPNTPEGKAKIAKACMAMRNNDGGRLIIGFKDDGTPDPGPYPADISTIFLPVRQTAPRVGAPGGPGRVSRIGRAATGSGRCRQAPTRQAIGAGLVHGVFRSDRREGGHATGLPAVW